MNRSIVRIVHRNAGHGSFFDVLAFWSILELRGEKPRPDSNGRWMSSAIVAVLLVNLVLGAFVVHCFLEGFPKPAVATGEEASAKGEAEATEKEEVKEEKKEK